jgi:hypothetical protein
MCHTQDGRDLKYFNYSNQSIAARAMFHGLSSVQGNQIVSYIRSLNVPNPGRPWNPPYQPGPGMDSLPVSQWAAGAGINAVLNADTDMLPYLMPGGSTAKWASNSYMNARETPIALQLPDWNRWLPTIHPIDAWGSLFTTSSLWTEYLNIRSQLVPNDPVSYSNWADDIRRWILRDLAFAPLIRLPSTAPGYSTSAYAASLYSLRLWSATRNWELNQQFGLEGMAQVVFGPQAANRAWYTGMVFDASPFMADVPRPSPAVGNGLPITYSYLSFAWYHTQLVLNDGNLINAASWPVDYPYALGYLANDLVSAPNNTVGTGSLMGLWLTKDLQNISDVGNYPSTMVVFPAQVGTWAGMTSSQKLQVMNAYLAAWFGKFSSYTPAQLFAISGLGATQTFDPTQPNQNFGSSLYYALPQLRSQGVDSNLLNRVAAWAGTIWPAYNWVNVLNAPCRVTNSSSGQVTCTPVNP